MFNILLFLLMMTGIAQANTEISTAATNLGIGTTSVSNALSIASTLSVGDPTYTMTTAPSNGVIIQGNVGIGTSSLITRTMVLGSSGSATGFRLNNLNGGKQWDNLSIGNGSTFPVGSWILFNQTDSKSAITATTTENVGIGTFLPSSILSVGGGTSIGASYTNGISAPTDGLIVVGNVGIGSISPGQKLDVQGTVRALFFSGNGSALTGITGTGWTTSGNDVYETSGGNVGIGTTLLTTSALTVMNGNVGIGTWIPSASLNIVGTGNNLFSTNVGIGTLTAGAILTVSGTGNSFIGANLGVGSTNPGVELDVAGTVRFTKQLLNRTSSTGIGWTDKNAANQACNTTCSPSACVVGLDAGTVGVLNSNFVACTDASADDCLCAGP